MDLSPLIGLALLNLRPAARLHTFGWDRCHVVLQPFIAMKVRWPVMLSGRRGDKHPLFLHCQRQPVMSPCEA